MIQQLLTIAYAGVGVVGTLGYVPTINDLLVHKKMSANINSYITWTFCTGITSLYALVMTHDWLLQLVTGINFGCCALVLALSIFVKQKMRG